MNDDSSAELMAAILNVHEAMGFGFSRVDERFAEQDKKIEHLRNDFTRRFDLVDDRFDLVDERFARMDERFDRMDGRFDRMYERFDRMDERFDRLDGRVAALEPHDHSPAS